MRTIKIKFYDKAGDVIGVYDTGDTDIEGISGWEEWYSDPATEHYGEPDGTDQWEVVYA